MITKHKGPRTVAGFEKSGQGVLALYSAKAKAEKGDPKAKLQYFMAQLEMGQLKLEEAQKRLEEFKSLTADEKKKIDALMVDVEVMDIASKVGKNDPAGAIAAGGKFHEMKKAGRPVPSGEESAGIYWSLLMAYYEDQKDAASYEAVLNSVKARFGKNINPGFLKRCEETLKKLKGE